MFRLARMAFAVAVVMLLAPPVSRAEVSPPPTVPRNAIFVDGEETASSAPGQPEVYLENVTVIKQFPSPRHFAATIREVPAVPGSEMFSLEFSTGAVPVQKGVTYDAGSRRPGSEEALPGFHFNGDGCNYGGRFTIDDVAFDSNGDIALLAMRFEGDCGGPTGTIHGAFAWQSSAVLPRHMIRAERLYFGRPIEGERSGNRVVRYTNTGTAPNTVSDVRLSGPDIADFAIGSDECKGKALAPGASCEVEVHATPKQPTARAARLTFVDSLTPTAGTGRDVVLETDGRSANELRANGGGDIPPVERFGGEDRISTSVLTSQGSFANGRAKAVVLAAAGSFADALAGTPLAVAKQGPLLLTASDALDGGTFLEIQRVMPNGTVYVLGGQAAISDAVVKRLQEAHYVVFRLGGPDRYETATLIAEQGLESPNLVFEASGNDFPDALSAGAAAAARGGAVLLTAGREQSQATSRYLSAHPSTRFAIGGPAAAADPTATAIVGEDRYATAVLVASRFFTGPSNISAANGTRFPDAISGGAFVGARGGPMLLVSGTGPLPTSLADYLKVNAAAIRRGFVHGGTGVVSNEVADEIRRAMGE